MPFLLNENCIFVPVYSKIKSNRYDFYSRKHPFDRFNLDFL